MDYINGNRFLDIADFAIDFDHNDLNTNIFKKNATIFCKTDFIDVLFDYIKLSGRSYHLITHMSDHPIDEVRFKKAPKCITKWYAENAVYEHENLIPIPLGLENHKGRSKGKFTDHAWLERNIDTLRKDWPFSAKHPYVYCNWNPNTNQSSRKNIVPILEKNEVPLSVKHGLSFMQYIWDLARYKFVLCPPGNGVDTHRVWETLYLGSYPIVLKHHIYSSYDLPILQVNDWQEVTPKLLSEFAYNWKDKQSFDQLKMSWWKNLIIENFKNADFNSKG